MIIDLFAGPGGWDEGLRLLGRHHECIGIEWDEAACKTARAAGHMRDQFDIAALDPAEFAARNEPTLGPVEGLIASPPCQSFSTAGKQRGRADKQYVIQCAHELAAGFDSRHQYCHLLQDERSLLTVEPLRWALALRPRWIAFEQVPAVLELWTLFASLLAEHGYHATAGVLTAEQYGVPQTRKRAYLVASLDGPVSLPEPTHSKYYGRDSRRLDPGLLPWVSMAEALGWGMCGRPAHTITGGGTATGGAEPFGNGARQQQAKARARGEWTHFRANARANATVRPVDAPAPTITAGQDSGDRLWVYERPATTVNCDPRISRPGRHDPDESGSQQRDAIRVTAEEAAILQGFPPGYPWQGSKTKQFQQIGNAVCPPVGARVLAEAMRLPVELAEAA